MTCVNLFLFERLGDREKIEDERAHERDSRSVTIIQGHEGYWHGLSTGPSFLLTDSCLGPSQAEQGTLWPDIFDALILIHFFGGLLYVLALMLFDPLFLHPRTKTSCLQLGRGDLIQWKTRTPSSNTRDNLRPTVIALWEKVVRTTPETNKLDI